MGWEKWYEEHEIDPGPLGSWKDILQLPLFPIYLVLMLLFGLWLIVGGLLYAIWLGVKEMRVRHTAARHRHYV